ncbi:MAG: hypothetical protein V3U35_01730 [Candidatus Neomarinimicrobiota bacterium]
MSIPGIRGLVALSAVAWLPDLAWGCATCFGAPEDPVTTGIKIAMMSMLGVTMVVLGSIGAFMVHLGRKSKSVHASQFPDQHNPSGDGVG